MLHLKLTDGSDIFINSLSIRYVLGNGHADQCDVYYDGSNFHTVLGDAKKIADTIHKALHVIHIQT